MLESFPFGDLDERLEEEDFVLFANGFRQIVASRIPSSGSIHFIGSGGAPKLSTDPRQGAEISATIESMRRSEITAGKVGTTILLSFSLTKGQFLIVAVSNVDLMVIELCTLDWLEDTREIFIREFLLFKRSYKDVETNLLNVTHFWTSLEKSAGGNNCLILLQASSRGTLPRDSFHNSQRAATVLTAITDSRFQIHHLGQSIFAILAAKTDIGSVERLSSSLVQHFKRESFLRVHVGSSCKRSLEVASTALVDEAWTALQVAAKRGPFSFCDYSFLANADTHPLRGLNAEITEKYLQLSKKDAAYCVVYFSSPQDAEALASITDLLLSPKESTILGIDRGTLIYLAGVDCNAGLAFAENVLQALKNSVDVHGVYAGLSCYPYQGFSKPDVLLNARKALLHAEFFGPGHAVHFDAVSLNVSGDIHFSDGDMAGALREYRRGLEYAPQDVNLLNSLGVTYALLNKNHLARNAFEKVIQIDPDNYMALYNLGLGAKLRGDTSGAIQLFEKAYRGCSVDDDKDFCREVQVQLGELYCTAGRYAESLQCLESWSGEVDERQQRRILKFFGEAHLGNGNMLEAMGYLQRAVQQNPFDHEVLGLLGSAIWMAREGDDIALSFCRKSVDLAPNNELNRLRLAKIQHSLGQHEEALESLARCRGRNVRQVEVQLLKAAVYLQLQRPDRVRFWARKVKKQSIANSPMYMRAQALLNAIDDPAKLTKSGSGVVDVDIAMVTKATTRK